MKIKQRKRTVVIKKLRSVYINDQKTKSIYCKLRPLPPLVTPLPNTVYTFFRIWGPGAMAQCPPPYASGFHCTGPCCTLDLPARAARSGQFIFS